MGRLGEVEPGVEPLFHRAIAAEQQPRHLAVKFNVIPDHIAPPGILVFFTHASLALLQLCLRGIYVATRNIYDVFTRRALC